MTEDGDDTLASGDTAPPAEYASSQARYTLGEVIGQGGVGEVVSALDKQIGRTVAIKRLKAQDSSTVTRFLREARIQGRLEHPAIVPVHELFWSDEARQ